MELRDNNGLTERQFLERYSPGNYPRPSVTADIVLFATEDGQEPACGDELSVLLIRRAGHPCMGQWALPGGFVNPGETVTEAARRELAEETGVMVDNLQQVYTFSKPGRDPRTWVISCAHTAVVERGAVQLRAGDDAADARWFSLRWAREGDMLRLRLTSGGIELDAVVACAPEYEALPGGGLAFDHAGMIACAVCRLGEAV